MQIPHDQNERVNEVIEHLARRVATLEEALRRALGGDETDGMLVIHHVPKEPEPPESNVIDFAAVLQGIQTEQEATEWYNTWRLAFDAGVGQIVTAEGTIIQRDGDTVVTYSAGDLDGQHTA